MTHTILVVDDSPYIVDGLVALLTRKGYSPLPSYSGDEALEILKAKIPDIILLDIMMEPMDGWETLERIKQDPRTNDIPVLMFSAKKITPDEAKEHSMGIDDFVSKPVNPTQLLESIERIFARREDVKMEMLIAKESGLDPKTLEEYSSLRRNIEVDRNMLAVLKNSTGMDIPGRVVGDEESAAIRNLEEQIVRKEARLKEINEQVTRKL